MIEFRNVSKVYDSNGTHALSNVNIKIEDGEFVFVVGSSGAGKSTFLKLIMHEEKPTEGEIIFNEYSSATLKKKQVPYYRREMGIVFQDFRLIPKMSVYDNVAFAMRVIGAKEKEIRKPTGNVDPEMSHEIVGLLTKINNAGTTVIMVTHEHDLVRSFQRRVIVIKNGEVVSDTPDPTHAQFTGENPKADTDMFFFDEDVEIDNVDVLPKDENEEDIFDNLESVVSDESTEEEQGGEQ